MFTKSRLLIAVTLAAAVPATMLSGQETASEPYEIGKRIRIIAPAHGRDPIVGVVDSLRESSIVLDTAYRERRWFFDPGPILTDDYRRIAIPFDDIRGLEVSRGRSRAKGALRGAVVGGLVGAMVFGFTTSPQFNPGWNDFKKGIVPGLAVGLPVGAVAGYLWGRERWRAVPGPFRPGRRAAATQR